jgi:antirestriction protein ArdC
MNDRAAELLERLKSGVAELTTSDDWLRYLDVARRFHTYSFWNTIAILTQRPDATRVAGYRTWHDLGRQVRKGETGIRILAPCIRRRRVDDEETGETTETTRLRGFKTVSVFDIAQTDGQRLPTPPVQALEGTAPEILHHQLAAAIRAEGFTFTLGPLPTSVSPTANGVTSFDTDTVTVRDDLSAAQRAKTTAHELAHVLLHRHAPSSERARCEVEAESVAYIVMTAHDIDADAYSFGYLASWSRDDPNALQRSGDAILASSRKILERLSQPLTGEPAA